MSLYSKEIWDNQEIIRSSDGNVLKLVYTKDDAIAETVLYKYPAYRERTVICCSVMSGCPVGCRFCGTGDFFIRNLTAKEIVAQVEGALDIVYSAELVVPANIEKLQIMFMSMGEPMLNWDNTKEAIEYLYSRYPNAALLLSTMAPQVTLETWGDLMDLSARIPTLGLQFSVHEAIQEKRDALIPMKRKMSLPVMGAAGADFLWASGRQPFFNYCVGEDNGSDREADLLEHYFDPAVFQCTLSVICERDEGVAAANERQRSLVTEFSGKLLERGFSVRVFDPAGQDDIGGGCGQLHFVQSWSAEHPELNKVTHGTGLPKVHTPLPEV